MEIINKTQIGFFKKTNNLNKFLSKYYQEKIYEQNHQERRVLTRFVKIIRKQMEQ